MTRTKNHTKRNLLYVSTFIAAAGFLFLANDQLDSKIANHPKIVTIEVTQKHIVEKLDTVLSQQEVLRDILFNLDDGMSKLLKDEYP